MSDLMTSWIWVSLPHATFAVVTRGGKVVGAAPIARWTIGKPERQVADYYRRKGAEFARLSDDQEDTQTCDLGFRESPPHGRREP